MSSDLRWTKAELDARLAANLHLRMDGAPPVVGKSVTSTGIPADQPEIKKGVVRQMREMNGTEKAFMAIQEARIRRGDLVSATWEGITFLLPGQIRYKCDFVLRYEGNRLEFAETKGGKIWPQDLVRYKIAADVWSWLGEFQMWQKLRGRDFERIR